MSWEHKGIFFSIESNGYFCYTIKKEYLKLIQIACQFAAL
jgi:hypothetical protein